MQRDGTENTYNYDTLFIKNVKEIVAPIHHGSDLKEGMIIAIFTARAGMDISPGNEMHKKDITIGGPVVEMSFSGFFQNSFLIAQTCILVLN